METFHLKTQLIHKLIKNIKKINYKMEKQHFQRKLNLMRNIILQINMKMKMRTKMKMKISKISIKPRRES